MPKINISTQLLHTDLIIEQPKEARKHQKTTHNGLKIEETWDSKNHYTTIFFKDISDQDSFQKVQDTVIEELQKYLKVEKNDKFLIIGLGNSKSTPDSLGPATIERILVTRYLFLLGEVEDGYSNVAAFSPNVMANTGMETSSLIKSIIQDAEANKVIIIDALKTNHLERLGKTIQITNKGIAPGSGIGNMRKEMSKKTLNVEVIAIGIPTVVDIRHIHSSPKDISEYFIVTPTNIDFMIEKLALLLSNVINISLHKNFIRQNYH